MSEANTKQQSRKRGESKYQFPRCENCVGKPERQYCADCRRTLNRMRQDNQNPDYIRKDATPGESQYEFGRCESCVGKTIKELCANCLTSYWKTTRNYYNSPQHQGRARKSQYNFDRCPECADKPQRQLCSECGKRLRQLQCQNHKSNRPSKAKGIKRGPKPGTPSPLKGITSFDAPRCIDCNGKGLTELCSQCWQAYYTARYRHHNGPYNPHKERKFRSRGRTRFRHILCDKCVDKVRRDYCHKCDRAYRRVVAQAHYQPSTKQSAPHIARVDFKPCAKCEGKPIKGYCRRCKQKYRKYSGTHHRHRAKKLGRICEHGPGCVPPPPFLAAGQRWRCPSCGANLKRTGFDLDHFQPYKPKGDDTSAGYHCIANVQILCSKCNKSKNNRDPIEWAQSQGRLF